MPFKQPEKVFRKFLSKVKLLVTTGDQRSLAVKKNMLISVFLKGFSIIISLLLVPLTLNYLNAEEYGIWLTLSSILTWIGFFDIGLGNGLRNKLTEALSLGKREDAKIYVSTTFAILLFIMTTVFVLFALINPFLSWTGILNASPEMVGNLGSIVVIVFAFFCLQFIFKTVGLIFVAHQKPALNDLLGVCGSALSLLIIYLLTLFTEGSLYNVAIAFSLAPTLVFIVAYFIVFYGSKQYRYLRPTWRNVKLSKSKDLMGLGVQFFVVQIAGLVMYTTSNIIISQTLGPEQVSVYNIAYKYFSIAIMCFSIVQSTMWNAYTDAWVNQDIQWIRRAIKRMIQMWVLLGIVAIVMLLASGFIYRIWIGNSVTIPFSLSLACALLTIVNNWSSIWVNFINGVGKMRMQLLSSIVVSILFIPLSLFFCKQFGVVGIVFGSMLGMLPGVLLCPIQFSKLMNHTAKGIWNK